MVRCSTNQAPSVRCARARRGPSARWARGSRGMRVGLGLTVLSGSAGSSRCGARLCPCSPLPDLCLLQCSSSGARCECTGRPEPYTATQAAMGYNPCACAGGGGRFSWWRWLLASARGACDDRSSPRGGHPSGVALAGLMVAAATTGHVGLPRSFVWPLWAEQHTMCIRDVTRFLRSLRLSKAQHRRPGLRRRKQQYDSI